MITINMKVGPTFANELTATVPPLIGLKIGTTPDSVFYDGLTEPQLAQLKAVIAAHDPSKQLPPPPTIIAKIDLWRAMTDAEHAAMVGPLGVAGQPQRIQDIFNAVDNFRSDAPEWSLLQAMATKLYGPERAAQLLTPAST